MSKIKQQIIVLLSAQINIQCVMPETLRFPNKFFQENQIIYNLNLTKNFTVHT